ncbi:phenylalanine--tRNA ligase subunit beta [Longimonas halophila]|uniref:Phenylalanine--tRNA ligase beta subunit n=1 Tax=Longimonas halophila TaxID=1469170 RepID=A0A2H3NZ99_9BACT|nr:phenylalanine--tRNA ligase subunit beta [Longimonas halophila]PEN08343.1 phenylalanine--tRNA ligase subunit beta [Longimonas halophila]
MDCSIQWLRRYAAPQADADTIADLLTMAGLEVDGIARYGQPLDDLVIGHIEAVHTHPNADRLVLCDVATNPDATVQIVCGAPNVAAGQRVPVAPAGTTLQLPTEKGSDERQPITLEAREIRGEMSNGMICSAHELGLTSDASGIMVLDDEAPVGMPFVEYLQAHNITPTDTVLDIDLTPNRADAASHIGVARDLSALTGAPLHRPNVDLPDEGGPVAERFSVSIADAEACPRYVALCVEDVEVGPSPVWLQQRLERIGLRPRNVIVDITNFVLHECGQPLHAFDADTLHGNEIHVGTATEDTPFTTLDDQERTCPAGTLFIRDAERPVAIAGVMGGADTEVTEDTTTVLIESAYFDPSHIRRTAKALALQTDSSYRFERGVDRDGQVWAAARAADLMVKLAGGTRVNGMIDAHPHPPEPRTVTLRPERANALLGTDLARADMQTHLESIGIAAEPTGEGLRCTLPTWRPDLAIEEDLIEEVARLHGYDRIPRPERIQIPARIADLPGSERTHRNEARQLLRGAGFREIYTNSMLPLEVAEQFNPHDTPVVETQNPISREMAALRPRLLPGALRVLQHNHNHGQDAIRLFEFGRVMRRATADEATQVPGTTEHEALLIAATGPDAPRHWDRAARNTDVYDLKGTVADLLSALGAPAQFTPSTSTPRYVAYALDIAADDVALGTLACIHPDTAAHYDLDEAVLVAELDWEAVSRVVDTQPGYQPVPRVPVVERDLAVLVDANAPVGPLLDTAKDAGAPLVQQADLFDLYEGKGIPSGQKSVALSVRLAADHTLTDSEIDACMDSITSALQHTHSATLRQQ